MTNDFQYEFETGFYEYFVNSPMTALRIILLSEAKFKQTAIEILLNSKYRAEEYKKNPYKGKEVISANTTESFNWVRPLFIDVNIALGATILGLILFGVLDITSLFRKEKENEKLQ